MATLKFLDPAAFPLHRILNVHWPTSAGRPIKKELKELNLDFWNKLQQTRFPGVFLSGARNERLKKYPWVSEDVSFQIKNK